MAGKDYREGITLVELMRMFPDDETAERWFAEQKWEGEPCCTHCGSVNVQVGAKHPTMPYRCRDCRRRFSVRHGTVMEGSHLGYQTWALAIYLLTTSLKGVSSLKLHRDLGITQKSAWHLAHRLRRAWEDDGDKYGGPVEVDETYVGGKMKYQPASKRNGRGVKGKTPVVGGKDRDTNQVVTEVVASTDKATLQGFVNEHVEPGARVCTDEHRSYRGLPNHEAVKHSAGEFVRGEAHTQGIDSFWSMLKRGYMGTYHWMSTKHLHRYTIEFAGRHNVRPLDTVEQMRAVARGLVGRRLRYRTLTGKEG